MATVLFIKANNRPLEQAVSVQLYDAFYRTYTETHPEDTIVEVDLFQEDMPYMDSATIAGAFKASKGMELTAEEQQRVAIADRHLDQFLAADKVVFGFPLWNFTVPAVLHTYFDYLNRAGKTFRYTPEGPVGLATGKKAMLLNARGGVYSEGAAAAAEMAVTFVERNLQLFGVTQVENVIIEGHNQFPAQRDELVRTGIEQAAKAAASF